MAKALTIDEGGTLYPALPSGVVTGLQVTPDGDLLGAMVSYTQAKTYGVGTRQILRAIDQQSLNIATVIATNVTSYDDRAAAVADHKLFYWVRVWDVTGTYFNDYGPVSCSLVAPVTPQVDSIVSMDASASAVVDGVVEVTVAIETKPGIDFQSMLVFVSNYDGNASSRRIAQIDAKSVKFHLQQTNELVNIEVAVVNSNGEVQPAGLASRNILLNGVKTSPHKPMEFSGRQGLNTSSFRFRGNTDDVVRYTLYRNNIGGGMAGAVVVTDLTPTDEEYYIIEDWMKTLAHEWYLVAVNSAGNSDPQGPVIITTPY